MTHKYLDGVQQTATGVGTGGLTLGSATTGEYRTMQVAGMGNGDTGYFRIQHATLPSEWEVVLGTYASGTLTRTFDSNSKSATGGLIAFSAGTKIVSGVLVVGGLLLADNNGDTVVGRDLTVTRALRAPAGSAAAPSVAVRQATSGVYSPAPHSIAFRNAYQGVDPGENHEEVKVTHRGSLVIGKATGTNDNRLPNQSALEICIENNGGSGVPFTWGEWNSAGAAVEPLIGIRSRGTAVGDVGAVQAGDGVFTLQGQVDDGLGTANVALGNLSLRVQSGATITPISGNVRTYPGQFLVALAPGDGVTAITSRFGVRGNGDVDVYTGNLLFGTVNTVISSTRRARFSAMRPDLRLAIPDDTAYQFVVPGGGTAIIKMIATALAATTPHVIFSARVDSAACEKLSVSSSADAANNVIFATGAYSGTITDYTDGKLTLSADSAGNVWVINRLGASKTYSFFVDSSSQTA